MREFTHVIKKAFSIGLRPSEVVDVNYDAFVELKNVEVTELGIRPFRSMENLIGRLKLPPIYKSLQVSWPFPQLFRFRDEVIVADSRVVYSVDQDNKLRRVFSVTSNSDIWDAADFGRYKVMVNDGSVVAVKDYYSNWSNAPSSTFPLCSTICNFRGQLIAGNIGSSWHSCDDGTVAWSKIGSADFTPDKSNEAGFMKMLFEDSVVRVKPLKNMVVVYGYNGLRFLAPVTDPVASFGLIEPNLDFGVFSKGAVVSSPGKHYFIRPDGMLCVVENGAVGEVGYREFLSQLLDEHVIASYDRASDLFFFSNSKRTFMLSKAGMSEVSQHPTSVAAIGNEVQCIALEDSSNEFFAVTAPFDMGVRRQKTIFSISVACSGTSDLKAAVDWRMGQSDEFSRTNWVKLNREGVAYVVVAGVEFRVCLKGSFSGTISYINVSYKFTDSRSVRGVTLIADATVA